MTDALDEINRALSDLRARRSYLLDSRKGPDDGYRATELRWLNRQEEELLKRQRAEMANRRRLRGGS